MLDISIKAEELLRVGGFPITNTLTLTWFVVISVSIGALLFRKQIAMVPMLFQNIVEVIFEALIGFMEEVYGTRTEAERYFPFIATIFLFILFNNWFGVLPFLGALGFFEIGHEGSLFVPLFRTAASDINTTLPLAIISVIATHLIGIVTLGLWRHTAKFLNFSSPIDFAVGILEFVAEIAKMVSFSFRLFGNIFAGEVLLLIVSFLSPYIAPVPFYLLEIFVGFVQALVFAMLTMVFIKIAITSHEYEIEHSRS